MTGLCLSRRTVLHTHHARMLPALVEFCISHLKCFFYLPTVRPVVPPCHWIWSLPKFWTNSLFPKRSGQNWLIQHASKFGNLLNMSMMSRTGQVFSPVLSHQSWTACTSLLSHVHTKQRVPETPSSSPGGRGCPGEDTDAPIESNRRRTLIEEHARHYRFQLQLSRQPSDTPLGRLDREKDRSTFTVISLAKVASVAARSAHTKHIEVAPGISFNLGTHEPPEQGDSKAMGLAQWLLKLRTLYNCYSIIGVRKVATSAICESMRCSWQVVSYFVDTLTDLATANIPGTKMRPTTGVLQLAELNLRTRVVELLRLGAEGGCLTFDDAFNKAFIEKQSLFHCALSPQTQVSTVAKPSLQHQALKRAADSRTSDRQARRKTDSQSAEPRPRPQYSNYTPDGSLICPDYNTRGCSLSKCWYKSLNAVHCCDVWGCYQEHPRWDH